MSYESDLKQLRQKLKESEKHNPNGYPLEQVYEWMKLAYLCGAKGEKK